MQINKLMIIILIAILIVILGGCVERKNLEEKNTGEVGEKKIFSNQGKLNNKQAEPNNNINVKGGLERETFSFNKEEIGGLEDLLGDLEKNFSDLDINDISGDENINLNTEI